ncbi:hypothetical protein FOA52_002178 [Chlamydomonas sp. UWO 241]|nr:hypothetical protein FOA52_002178 [Chlamydomonas sp. UWO 241]
MGRVVGKAKCMAFNERIAADAVALQCFGGPHFSTKRMTWIKPNFLWMMYRCGWATKDENQARVLQVTLARSAFDTILASAWPSSYDAHAAARYGSRDAWQAAKAASSTVLQWDPDHDPHGGALPRRAAQLGLRPRCVSHVYNPGIVCIRDVTPFVLEQSARVAAGEEPLVPAETVYTPQMDGAAEAVGIDQCT